MSSIDIIFIFFITIISFISAMRGIIKEVFSVASFVIAFIAASMFKDSFYFIFEKFSQNIYLLKSISFLVIFFVVSLSVFLLGFLVRKIVKFVRLGWLDRLVGTAFGVFKATIIIGVFLYLIEIFTPLENSLFKESKIAPVILCEFKNVSSFVSSLLRNR